VSYTCAGNLECRADSIREQYPGTTIYDIGDPDHQQRESDHNKDSRGIVHAIDVMTYEDTGKGNAVVEWMLAEPDDLEYVIFNGKIWSRSYGFDERDYDGSDDHSDHVHASGKHGSTGYTSATGTGYDVDAEAMRPKGFGTKSFGGEMFLYTVEGDPNVWKSNGFKRAALSGPNAGGVNTYNAYKPLTEAGVPLANYTASNIAAMGLTVEQALDHVGGKLAGK
jgi:hypothetical protein